MPESAALPTPTGLEPYATGAEMPGRVDITAPHPVPAGPVQWMGGKGNLAARLLPLLPVGGRPYTECYMGGAALFWRRDPAPVEVLNDLNGDLVNLFRCLQSRDTFDDLKHRLTWTLYARGEFERALTILADPNSDPITRAWATFVRLNQGHGAADTPGRWGRGFTPKCGMSSATNQWLMRLSMLDAWRLRLQRVQIDRRDALGALAYWDTPDAVHYVDPPYVLATRSGKCYKHETDDAHHRGLVDLLLRLEGAVVVSGYAHPIYDPLDAAGWERIEWAHASHTGGKNRGQKSRGAGNAMKHSARTEVVWRNPEAVALAPRAAELETGT